MAEFYVCPECRATVAIIRREGEQMVAECYEHGVVRIDVVRKFVDAPGQQSLFGGLNP